MQTRNYDVTRFKALTNDDPPGSFEAVVAVFGNVDRAGEVIERGAFTESLAEGLPPIVWSHQWGTPPIGVTLAATETEEGLLIKGRLRVAGDAPSPLAQDVWGAMTDVGGDGKPSLKEWSVGLTVKSERYEDRDGQKVVVLEKLGLVECGPCLKGVNPATRTVNAKAEDFRAAIERGAMDPDELRKALDLNPAADGGDNPPPSGGGATPEQRREIAALLLT